MMISKLKPYCKIARLMLWLWCYFIILLPHVSEAASTLVVVRPEGNDFINAVTGLKDELSDNFTFNEIVLNDKITVSRFSRKLNTLSPQIIILMDNRATGLYSEYIKNNPSKAAIPVVSVMAAFMDLAIKPLKNASGIYYEVPVVTSIVNLRIITRKQYRKVGIIHRKFLSPFIEKNKVYCAKEGIELISYEITDDKKIVSGLKKGLKYLNTKQKVDALWLPNDIWILNAKTLRKVWIPFTKKNDIPMIVGVEVLVNPNLDLGTFCVVPDHYELGMQAAEIVFDAMDNNWNLQGREVEPPRSVFKILNLKQADSWYDINEKTLQNVDKILK